MEKRLKLHQMLLTALENENLYFQPPENVQLKYPCIIYKRVQMTFNSADNNPYTKDRRYQIMVIDKDPDSSILDRVSDLPGISYVTHYTVDFLNHDIFNIHTQSF